MAKRKSTQRKTAPGRTPARRAASPSSSSSGRGAYDRLCAELRRIATLSSTLSLLGWDQETMMPPRGAELRAAQREALSTIVHERRTSKELGDLLSRAETWAARSADPRTRANLREARRDYDKATRLPASLVSELARCASLGMEAWKEARQRSDFKRFLPWLRRTVELSRQKARCYGVPRVPAGVPRAELYDALLDEYEPDMTAVQVEAIFGPLRARLTPLIGAVARSARKPSEAVARQKTAVEDQKAFVRAVCAAVGFDYDAGRMDESTHPFCEGIGPGDTRMTNRYRADGWLDSLSTAMHETGHCLYEQGLPKAALFGQPLAEAVSLGIHESQSRMWENLIGRSRPFWVWARREAAGAFGGRFRRLTADELHRCANIVRPGLIRVESDELTYNLHIMLRFDLERAMVNGSMDPADLPDAWNERIRKDLGLRVPDHRRGCLQDVHWSAGLVGYFPTYTLGNLYASQFWEAMGKDIPGRDRLISRGEFAPVLAWLRGKIHAHGRRFSASDLCRRVTGAPLSHDPLLRHLQRKVRAVYGDVKTA